VRLFLEMASRRGCAATETVEQATNLRVEGGDMQVPEKKMSFEGLRGMTRARNDSERRQGVRECGDGGAAEDEKEGSLLRPRGTLFNNMDEHVRFGHDGRHMSKRGAQPIM
jgi:hypothetical protein